MKQVYRYTDLGGDTLSVDNHASGLTTFAVVDTKGRMIVAGLEPFRVKELIAELSRIEFPDCTA